MITGGVLDESLGSSVFEAVAHSSETLGAAHQLSRSVLFSFHQFILWSVAETTLSRLTSSFTYRFQIQQNLDYINQACSPHPRTHGL